MAPLPIYLSELFPSPFSVVLPAYGMGEAINWYSGQLGFIQQPDRQVVGIDRSRVSILASQWQDLCILKSNRSQVETHPSNSYSEQVDPLALIVNAHAFDHLLSLGSACSYRAEQSTLCDSKSLVASVVCQDPSGNWFRLVREPDWVQLREFNAFTVWLTQLGSNRTIMLSCISSVNESRFMRRILRREPQGYSYSNGGVPIEAIQRVAFADELIFSKAWRNLVSASQSAVTDSDGCLDGDFLDVAYVEREKSVGERFIRRVPIEPGNTEDAGLILLRDSLLRATVEECVAWLSG